jgi:RNA polymerase sigma factor (sigma-70 family)
MTDAEILQLIQEEKLRPVIKKLYTYYPVVKKHIIGNSGSRQEAEDIFQDSLIVLFTKIRSGNFELSSGLHTYLFGVARLLWLEELRKKNKKISSETIAYNQLAETGIEADIREDSKVKKAQAAVEQLGRKCKQLLELFYFKKMSMKEIAKNLGFSSEKVAKNQKYRCIEKAKEYLKTN